MSTTPLYVIRHVGTQRFLSVIKPGELLTTAEWQHAMQFQVKAIAQQQIAGAHALGGEGQLITCLVIPGIGVIDCG